MFAVVTRWVWFVLTANSPCNTQRGEAWDLRCGGKRVVLQGEERHCQQSAPDSEGLPGIPEHLLRPVTYH